ncbi:hypothetical protein F7725_016223 [Dissostichus mawsoni]|uniref:Uncharacterized protein n=1 Tax=Dissostichus mawsoni TaxID=36200 RepID=A0A7J5Z1F2_DISMA|nr:hypothetical protein F7725_016223 [Dissostichus mawsoni]
MCVTGCSSVGKVLKHKHAAANQSARCCQMSLSLLITAANQSARCDHMSLLFLRSGALNCLLIRGGVLKPPPPHQHHVGGGGPRQAVVAVVRRPPWCRLECCGEGWGFACEEGAELVAGRGGQQALMRGGHRRRPLRKAGSSSIRRFTLTSGFLGGVSPSPLGPSPSPPGSSPSPSSSSLFILPPERRPSPLLFLFLLFLPLHGDDGLHLYHPVPQSPDLIVLHGSDKLSEARDASHCWGDHSASLCSEPERQVRDRQVRGRQVRDRQVRQTGERQTGERETGERETGETGERQTGERQTGERETGETGERETGERQTGEKTPSVPPSSLMETPISARIVSLRHHEINKIHLSSLGESSDADSASAPKQEADFQSKTSGKSLLEEKTTARAEMTFPSVAGHLVSSSLSEDDGEDGVRSRRRLVHVGRRHRPEDGEQEDRQIFKWKIPHEVTYLHTGHFHRLTHLDYSSQNAL